MFAQPSITASAASTDEVIAPSGFEQSDIVKSAPSNQRLATAVEPQALPTTASRFQALSPTRILDTRETSRLGYLGDKPIAGAIVRLPVRRVAGVAANASAVVGNLTVVDATGAGYVTAFPTGTSVPGVSSVNTEFAGQTIPNSVTVPIGSDGSISFFDHVGSHLVFDVVGFYVPVASAVSAGRTVTNSPSRVFDSRPGTSVNSDGRVVAATGSTKVFVAGRNGVPSKVRGVILNVTATEPIGPGWVQVGPFGGYTRGESSSLNVGSSRQTIANQVVVPLSSDGAIGLDVQWPLHLVIDITGYITDGTGAVSQSGLFVPLPPARVIDTRDRGIKPPGDRRVGVITGGYAGVPRSAYAAVAINATLVEASAPGFVQFAPAGTLTPGASSTLNADHFGQTIANAATLAATNQGLDAYLQIGAHLIVDVSGYFTGGPQTPATDPLGLLEEGDIGRWVGNGIDLFAVWLCVAPPDTTDNFYRYYAQTGGLISITAGDVANAAAAGVTAYFSAISSFRYLPVFWTMGTIQLRRNEGPQNCLNRAIDATNAPFTNVVAVDNTRYGGGFGGPGLIGDGPDGKVGASLFDPPATTKRGLWVGGGSILPVRLSSLFAHEIGHTLHWPHSYTGASESQYDNPVDLMSMSPQPGGWCPSGPYGYTSNCYIQHTLALNRYVNGWIDPSEIVLHTSGSRTVDLANPISRGIQFVAAKSSNPKVIATIEARPQVDWDSILSKGGVTIHISDERPDVCPQLFPWTVNCTSTDRRVSQGLGAPYSYDHVIGPGESLSTHGLFIENLGVTGSGYRTRISGTFVP